MSFPFPVGLQIQKVSASISSMLQTMHYTTRRTSGGKADNNGRSSKLSPKRYLVRKRNLRQNKSRSCHYMYMYDGTCKEASRAVDDERTALATGMYSGNVLLFLSGPRVTHPSPFQLASLSAKMQSIKCVVVGSCSAPSSNHRSQCTYLHTH